MATIKAIKIHDTETLQKIETLRKHLGLKNNSEVLRYIVNRYSEQLKENIGGV
jgi:hypothetical protein